MSANQLCNPFCNPGMVEDLKKTRVLEIAEDVWMIEGYAGTPFLLQPPSGNIFIMRDKDMVLLMDTGHHPFYRNKILEILRRFAEKGARELVLVLSHGHWDHGRNNDVIYEAGYEKVRFLLPEPEFHTLNIPAHMLGDLEKATEYFDPLRIMPDGLRAYSAWAAGFPEYKEPRFREAWQAIAALPTEYDRASTRAAWELLLTKVLCPDLGTYIIDRAEPLSLESREKRTFGEVEVRGWPIGRFFAIHDASQSPGHICVYDPVNKLMITGDATLELNPPFFDCDLGACIEICRKCLRLAEQGDILIATDCHRTSQWWPRCLTACGATPINPVQLNDEARGREACVAFYRFWLDYLSALEQETLLAHSRIGEAAVPEIAEELAKSDNPNMVFKLSLGLPNVPSSPEMLVARVMKETGASRRVVGDRVLFRPVKKWNF